MANEVVALSTEAADIQSRILTIRGVQVMLDRDLAELYGVDVKRLNEQVNRNIDRFPERFMHQLTDKEFADLKSQIATSSFDSHLSHLKSQIATSSWGGVRKPPKVFTEQGISMLSAVLRSPTAVEVSIRIMDAFVAMRRFLASNADVFKRIEIVERRQITDQSRNEARFDELFAKMSEGEVPLAVVFERRSLARHARFRETCAPTPRPLRGRTARLRFAKLCSPRSFNTWRQTRPIRVVSSAVSRRA